MFMNNIFKLHGLPDQIISDRGPQFVSQFWKAFCERVGMKSSLSTAFHPQTDGQTERVNQTLEQYLRTFSDYWQTNWVEHLPLEEFAYNNMMNATTQFSPFYSNFGFHPKADGLLRNKTDISVDYLDNLSKTLANLLDNIERAQKRQADFVNTHRGEVPFKVGDRVW
jgi:transposase InsO family protein